MRQNKTRATCCARVITVNIHYGHSFGTREMWAYNVVKSVTDICVIGTLAMGLRSDMSVTREIQSFAARSREQRLLCRCTV